MDILIAANEEISAVTKMWISFFGIGLMVAAAVVITLARVKTKGWLRIVLSIVAVILLLFGMLYAFISIA